MSLQVSLSADKQTGSALHLKLSASDTHLDKTDYADTLHLPVPLVHSEHLETSDIHGITHDMLNWVSKNKYRKRKQNYANVFNGREMR